MLRLKAMKLARLKLDDEERQQVEERLQRRRDRLALKEDTKAFFEDLKEDAKAWAQIATRC